MLEYKSFKIIKNITKYVLIFGYFLAALAVMSDIEMSEVSAVFFVRSDYIAISILYLIIMYLFLAVFEAFNVEQRRFLDLVYGQLFSAIGTNLFFAVLMQVISAVSIPESWIGYLELFLLESIFGVLWSAAMFHFYIRGQAGKEALFIYGRREDYKTYIKNNNHINTYFKITKSIAFTESEEKVLACVDQSEVVFIGDIPYEERNRILKYCMKQSIICYAVPKVSDIYIQNTDVLQLHDKMMLRYRETGLSSEKRVAKRVIDILISLLMLICALPVMLVIAVCIKMEDHGKVLYKQKRVTQYGREFEMYKFRSMRMDAEREAARLARKNDDRITKVGKVLRNIHFDELPQLVNILKGDMSIVGPRPERQEFIDEYSKIIPEFSERLKVKAGLTGYAQVYGKYNSIPEDKIKYDLMYIYNYSLRLDLKLILLTARILFQKENTEGVEADQVSAAREIAEGGKGDE